MKQHIGCYRRHYLNWEEQHKKLQPYQWEVPAQALTKIIKDQGFAVKQAPLGRGQLSEICWDTKSVLVDIDFKRRLRYPHRSQEVLHSTLCYELAHIVLHLGKSYKSHHEIEAWVWSTLFLCPWWLIRNSLDYKSLESEALTRKLQWQKVYGLAQWLEVSPTLVKMALDLYEIKSSPNFYRRAA